MKFIAVRRLLSLVAMALISLTIVTGCGGSGNSATGGGALAGTSSISGNVNGGISFYHSDTSNHGLLAMVSELVISPAIAAGVAGVEVQLLLNGTVVDSQTTDASGNFLFSELPPGSYAIRLMMDGQNLGESPPISLNANTKTKLELNLDGSVINMKVEAEENQIAGNINDDGVSDDMSSDEDSLDDDSSDDDSSDDDSSDDDSSDDDGSSDG